MGRTRRDGSRCSNPCSTSRREMSSLSSHSCWRARAKQKPSILPPRSSKAIATRSTSTSVNSTARRVSYKARSMTSNDLILNVWISGLGERRLTVKQLFVLELNIQLSARHVPLVLNQS